MQPYERVGSFYLGRRVDPAGLSPTPDLLLYDANDLTTHAVCVGMTGSGKTGLCLCLLEEAALDGVPVLAIDPKGDLGSLLLTFPGLRPEEFAPWIDEAEAKRAGLTPEAAAAATAERWRAGLAEWDQDAERIARLRGAAEFAIYTPGSSAGCPIQVLRSLEAPPAALRSDLEALAEKMTGVAAGLLALLGREADPLQSREHILIANLLQNAWSSGRSLSLEDLIREIQTPPLARIGVLDVDSFFPPRDRAALALALNNLLASPGFAPWLEGEPLDVQRLLWTPEGKPRVAVVSIAHLSDAARMFFVTLLLQEVVAWVRTQAGTSSLRAILYMDEIFGFFPPTANPPSKQPMLTLLKQARATGLGCVLATQNPVDLDYKGLANTGTWFLGRLQTERDKQRVLEGLAGARGGALDRRRVAELLSSLKNRVFLMHNVHDAEPVLFQTRWAMSYLRGPLTRDQIQRLMEGRRPPAAPSGGGAPPPPSAPAAGTAGTVARPVLPPESQEIFLGERTGPSDAYRAALLAVVCLHYVAAREQIDSSHTIGVLVPLGEEPKGLDWEATRELELPVSAEGPPADDSARFAAPPAAAFRPSSYARWSTQLRDHLYRTRRLVLWRDDLLGVVSQEGETEGAFRVRIVQLHRERRDAEVEKLRARYATRFARLQEKARLAEARVTREQSQLQQQGVQTTISIGASVLGALLGRKVPSVANVGRATTAARGVGRVAREREDVAQAQQMLAAAREELAALDAEFAGETAAVQHPVDPQAIELTERAILPRRADTVIESCRFVWVPDSFLGKIGP